MYSGQWRGPESWAVLRRPGPPFHTSQKYLNIDNVFDRYTSRQKDTFISDKASEHVKQLPSVSVCVAFVSDAVWTKIVLHVILIFLCQTASDIWATSNKMFWFTYTCLSDVIAGVAKCFSHPLWRISGDLEQCSHKSPTSIFYSFTNINLV